MPPKKNAGPSQAAPAGGRGHKRSGPRSAKSKAATSKSSKPRSEAPSQPVANGKRKRSGDDGRASSRRSKKSKVESGEQRAKLSRRRAAEPASPAPPPTINQAPTQVLAVLVFGNGDAGELGLGPSVQEARRPRLNPFLDPDNPSALHVVQLDCGGIHTIALTKTNEIVTWGVNDNGALGRDTHWDGVLRDVDGDSEEEDGELNPLESTPTAIPADYFPNGTKFVQVAAGDSCSFALTDHGLVYGWGTFKTPKGKETFGIDANGNVVKRQPRPTLLRGLFNITQIACGANHALALDVDGVIWSWGCCEQNQLGRRLLGRYAGHALTPDPIRIRGIKYVASGEYHSLAVDERDNVWAWGLNSFGEAGHAKTAGSDEGLLPYPMTVPGLRRKGVVHLAGGAHHSAAVTTDGQCLVWGRLDVGQLGIAFSPAQIQDGSLIRHDERNRPRICLRPTPVPTIGQVSYVACGTDHTIFITREGTVYATGFNSQAQLGLGHEDDVEVPELIKGKAVTDRMLTWAGAGGQFSIVAGPSNSKPIKGS
ncbi:hypothetical protein VTK56DRAFT_8778 [Thermocarpiscus australiensis]